MLQLWALLLHWLVKNGNQNQSTMQCFNSKCYDLCVSCFIMYLFLKNCVFDCACHCLLASLHGFVKHDGLIHHVISQFGQRVYQRSLCIFRP